MITDKYCCALKFIFTPLIFFSLIGTASAKVCYEDTLVAAHNTCDMSSSNSADFTTGCRWVPDSIVQTPVKCPPEDEAIWIDMHSIPYSAVQDSHSQVCSQYGLQPTTIDGAMCASGEKRPSTGKNVGIIEYLYGDAGSSHIGGGQLVKVKDNVPLGWYEQQSTSYGANSNPTNYGGSPVNICMNYGETLGSRPEYLVLNTLDPQYVKQTQFAVAFACKPPPGKSVDCVKIHRDGFGLNGNPLKYLACSLQDN